MPMFILSGESLPLKGSGRQDDASFKAQQELFKAREQIAVAEFQQRQRNLAQQKAEFVAWKAANPDRKTLLLKLVQANRLAQTEVPADQINLATDRDKAIEYLGAILADLKPASKGPVKLFHEDPAAPNRSPIKWVEWRAPLLDGVPCPHCGHINPVTLAFENGPLEANSESEEADAPKAKRGRPAKASQIDQASPEESLATDGPKESHEAPSEPQEAPSETPE